MKNLFYSALLGAVVIICFSFSIEKTPVFVETFQDIAVIEMQRTQIPASITMAQAIIESAWGNGVLARSSNNFFGIKCKKHWKGNTYFIEDDDFDKDGNLMKSCFRAYESIEDSFIDHSDFLVDNPRYASLFKLSSRDYIGWAYGLKACGYATDSLYAEKLIRKIEEYKLYELDNLNAQVEVLEAPIFSVGSDVEEIKNVESTEILSAPTYSIEEIVTTEVVAPEVPTQPAAQPITGEQINSPHKRSMIIDNNFGAVAIPITTPIITTEK